MFDEDFGLLEVGVVPGRVDQLEARLRDERTERTTVGRRHDPVARAPQDERGDGDPAEPPREVRVVHVRIPRVEAERLTVPRVRHQGLV